MDRIEIPGIGRLRMNQNRYFKMQGLPFDEGYERKRPVLEGKPTAYLEPFILDGKVCMIERGAFAASIASKKPIGFCIDHNTKKIFATTHDALEIFEDETGLTCRLDLNDVPEGQMLARISEFGRGSMSIGFVIEKTETRNYGGHDVEVILAASLVEISICRRGAVASAFCYVSDAERYSKPSGGHRSADFAISSATHRIKNASGKLTARNAALNSRLDAISERLGISIPVDSSLDFSGLTAALKSFHRH